MKIPNPWPNHPHTRCTRASDGVVCTGPAGPELEVPDADEVLLEPISFGRSDAPAVAPGKIWSEKWGLLDLEDHVKKVELEQQEAQLKADLEAKAAADKAAAAKAKEDEQMERLAAAEKAAAEKSIADEKAAKVPDAKAKLGKKLQL